MDRVYECDLSKKADVAKILEADPYGEDSFARAGYKVKDGTVLDEDKDKIYIYLSASEEFIKKADEKLKDVAKPASEEKEKRVAEKIKKEEEQAEAGFGSIFGD
ncbi:hypothetical protein KKB44_04805 [Candidatus Micrarchaeota archaeon]|nr:hypothetical protein [Candidatus Micrarchaeota archaeon]